MFGKKNLRLKKLQNLHEFYVIYSCKYGGVLIIFLHVEESSPQGSQIERAPA